MQLVRLSLKIRIMDTLHGLWLHNEKSSLLSKIVQ